MGDCRERLRRQPRPLGTVHALGWPHKSSRQRYESKESADGNSRACPGPDRGRRRAGLSLSLLLRQQGISSVLVERRQDVSWYPRARNLNFRTLEVFRGLGLEAEVIAAGSHVSRMFRKETLASPGQEEFPAVDEAVHIVDHPELLTPEPVMWYCPQSRLEPLLLAAARRRGGDVRYDTELISFTRMPRASPPPSGTVRPDLLGHSRRLPGRMRRRPQPRSRRPRREGRRTGGAG